MVEFTQEELTDIYRWAEHEIRAATFKSNVDRAKRIQAKVSSGLLGNRLVVARPDIPGSAGPATGSQPHA